MLIRHVSNYDVLEKCAEDILSVIKPVEGASVKPFGSFVSQLYAKSGDLDVSVELSNPLNLPTTKKKKQDTLREVRRALQRRGIARNMEFIPNARVPVLQYVSNQYGISFDISINNYLAQNLVSWQVKEWAKAQNINDPKNGTLNSYSLCLLVLFHFQTCEPAILPPLKEIYEGNIVEDMAEMMRYNEKHLDEVCVANIARFRRKIMGQRNQSSLSHLLASFFHKFFRIDALTNKVISTYTGRLERIQDNPRWMAKSYSLFVEDPFERPDNAARAVGSFEFQYIVSAFSRASNKFASDGLNDRNELLSLLCTPDIGSKLGGRVRASRYTSTAVSPLDIFLGHAEVVSLNLYDDQHNHQPARGGSRSGQSPHGSTNQQTAVHYQNRNHPQAYNTQRQTTGHHQNQNLQHAYTTGLQTPGRQYQNLNHPQPYPAGQQTGSPYQQNTQRKKENTPYRQSNGRAVTTWQEPVRGRFQWRMELAP
uniref:Poly(A) RNA polymerase mitochondrial-like central palm domain-containing protein n=1 Tax=Leersia perrieri TaxID=77586 RepID=A0A0D9V7R3_9ORYZ